jgi:5-methylthioadenosine/S-adenosylhomocysteine deaminase
LVEGELLATMDSQKRILRDSAVFIDEGKIVEVGEPERLRSQYRPEQVLGGERSKKKLILPGFVDCHDHTFITLYRQLGADWSLFDWLDKAIHPHALQMDEELAYQSARLCFAEQIKSGITTVMDDSIPWFRNSISKQSLADSIAKAALEAGTIVVQGVGGVDETNVLKDVGGEEFEYSPDKARKDAIDLIKKYNQDRSKREQVRIWTDPSWLPGCTREMFVAMKQVADDFHTFTYSHVAETKTELDMIKKKYGRTCIEYLDEFGFLGSNTLIAHSIWVNDSDITTISQRGTKVSHQPICNQYLASGIAPVPRMVQSGITIGLGIDDGGHMNQDFFGLMKSCVLIHKVATLDAPLMKAEKALEMATIEGARALGMSDEVGSIEPGKRANIIVVDLKRLNLWPPLNPLAALVYGGVEGDVETTIVNGRVVMENRKLTQIDDDSLFEETEKAAWRLVDKSGTEKLVGASIRPEKFARA